VLFAVVLSICLSAWGCDDDSTSAGIGQADADTDADTDTDGDADSDSDTGAGLVVVSPEDGEHYWRLEPVTFAGHTPGALEVFADDTWLLGGADEAGDFEFTYTFHGVGARSISFVVDGSVELEITVNIDELKARVCLEPGHPSSVGDKLYEAIINRKVAFYMEDMLRDAGYEVLNVVDDIGYEEIFDDDFDNEGAAEQALLQVKSLAARVADCNDWPADYFISIHHNAVDNPNPNYTLTLYGQDPSYVPWFPGAPDWASYTTDRLLDAMEVTHGIATGDRSFLGFSLYVLRNTNMIGILTEGSFYSNPAERERLNDNDYLYGEADAIFQGFIDFVE